MTTPRRLVGPLLACLLASSCRDVTSPAADAGPARPRPDAAAPDAAAEPAAGEAVSLVSGLGADVCAEVGAGQAAGARLSAVACRDDARQRFVFQSSGAITTPAGLCVDVAGGRAADRDSVVVWTCHGGANQRWTRTAANEIRTAVNGKCLTVFRGQVGGRLIVWPCGGLRSQRWTPRAPAAPAPPPPPSPGTWTPCAQRGAVCDGITLRDVRLGGPSGPYVQRLVYGPVLCEVSLFGGVDPAPGQALHCDAGPAKTATLAGNPMPGMNGLGSTVTVPLGDPGVGVARRGAAYTPAATGPDDGAFRTTCGVAAWGFFDPIVYPGRANAAHLHVFFGNTAVNPGSTPESLAAGGNSTCRGGTLNRSAYWAPALVDAATGQVLMPTAATVYYKPGYNMPAATLKPIPAGLRMVAGDMRAAAYQEHAGWGCRDRWTANTGAVPTTCPAGDAVRMYVEFPQCWDGRNLDSPDHKSHMAYPAYRNPPERSACPSTHPVALPAITEFFDYPVAAGAQPARWRLSSDMYDAARPGGYSAHADWMNGWDPAVMATFVGRCLNAGRDCQVGLLGDGTELLR